MASNNQTSWDWVSTRYTDETIIKTFPAGKTHEEIHEKTEREYPEPTWDWTIHDSVCEVHIFRNHWRLKEETMRKKGKTYEEIMKAEAIGKCLRMRGLFGDQIVETTKQCWASNLARGGRMNEGEARAKVEKDFADYIAEYGDEGM